MNLSGKTFGRLLVVERAPHVGRNPAWLCKCECGGSKRVPQYNLLIGKTRSCGCLQQEARGIMARTNPIEFAEIRRKAATKHGNRYSKTYGIWSGIKARCFNPNERAYRFYGARGITMCERWRNSFEAFLADVGEQPEGMEIDRINTRLGYFPGNTRWATTKQNARNKTNNRILTVDGVSLCVSEWAERIGVKHGTIASRIRNGWTHKRAIETPVLARKEGGK